MTKITYAQDVIDDLYSICDYDWESFSWALSSVQYTLNNECLNKSLEQILQDAFELVHFLVSSDDFEIGKWIPSPENLIKDVIYQGDFAYMVYISLEQFYQEAEAIFDEFGINADHFSSLIWLRKLKIGKAAPKLPAEIAKLFEPVGQV